MPGECSQEGYFQLKRVSQSVPAEQLTMCSAARFSVFQVRARVLWTEIPETALDSKETVKVQVCEWNRRKQPGNQEYQPRKT